MLPREMLLGRKTAKDYHYFHKIVTSYLVLYVVLVSAQDEKYR